MPTKRLAPKCLGQFSSRPFLTTHNLRRKLWCQSRTRESKPVLVNLKCQMLPYKVHIFWEGHKNFAKSSPNFWPINLCSLFPATVLNSSLCLSGSQSWNLIHWDGFWSISCLSVSNIPNIAKFWQCLECLSNLLKIQNWAGNTEKQVIGQK